MAEKNVKKEKMSNDVREDNDGRKKRTCNVSAVQKKMLLEFSKKNAHILRQKLSNKLNRKEINNTWENYTVYLNAQPGGAIKTASQWQRTLADQKKNHKKKLVENKKKRGKTGGGVSPQHEIDPEEEVAFDIPIVSIDGDSEIKESPVNFHKVNEISHDVSDDIIFETEESLFEVLITEEDGDGDIHGKNQMNNGDPRAMTTDVNSYVETKGIDSTIAPLSPLLVTRHCATGESSENAVKNGAETINQIPSSSIIQQNNQSVEKCTNVAESKGNPKDKSKGQENLFPAPSKNRRVAAHRQQESLRNSENIITISNREVEIREHYYAERLYRMSQDTRARKVKVRQFSLARPW